MINLDYTVYICTFGFAIFPHHISAAVSYHNGQTHETFIFGAIPMYYN